jgi:hypothetical protein
MKVSLELGPWNVFMAAIDPGKTTGVCIFQFEFPTKQWLPVECYELPWKQRFTLYEIINQVDYIIVEDFRLRSFASKEQIGSRFPSIHVIGMLQAFIWSNIEFSRLETYGILVPPSARDPFRQRFVEQDHGRIVQPKGIPASEHRLDAYLHARAFVKTYGPNKKYESLIEMEM